MKIVGLITEYNPFHNGHQYHIEEAKRVTGADYIIAVMSGDFVQRGVPAIIDKYHRAKMALHNGVDLVFELPVSYATSSAEYFAHGSVSLLDKLGIVDYICFGSECGDINLLREAATFLLNTPETFEKYLQAYIKDGLTYPAARLKALKLYLKEQQLPNADALSQVLTEPNNILGIEYMKALLRMKSSITPVTIQRISAHYHDENLGDSTLAPHSLAGVPEVDSDSPLHIISSATAIRKAIQNDADNINNFNEMKNSVPVNVYRILNENYQKAYPITEDDFLSNIIYKLMSEDSSSLTTYLDITSDLADRIKNLSGYYENFRSLTSDIKTKNMTLTRINRAILHLLLGIKTNSLNEYNTNGYVQYARVLGVKKNASHLLRRIEKKQNIPIITKVSKADRELTTLGKQMLSEDLFAAHLYNQAVYTKYGTTNLNEYKRGIVLL